MEPGSFASRKVQKYILHLYLTFHLISVIFPNFPGLLEGEKWAQFPTNSGLDRYFVQYAVMHNMNSYISYPYFSNTSIT